MQFVRPLRDITSIPTGFPGHHAQYVSQQESVRFFGVKVEEGGRAAGLHYHPVDQIYFVIRGTISTRSGDDVLHLGPHSFVHIPAGLAHCHWNENPGLEEHLEAVVPGSLPGAPPAVMVDKPDDVPVDVRAQRSATVTVVDPNRMIEIVPGMRAQTLGDASMGINSMTISYVELAAGAPRHGMHICDFDRCAFVLDGELTVEVGLQCHVVGPETLVLLPAGVPHRVYNAGPAVEKHLAVDVPPPSAAERWGRPVTVAAVE